MMNWIYLCFTISFIFLDNTMKTDSVCHGGSGSGSGFGSTSDPIPKATCYIEHNMGGYCEQYVSAVEHNAGSVDECCNICFGLQSECSFFLFLRSAGVCITFTQISWANVTKVAFDDCDIGYTII
jgi:hypothetical protein